MQLVKWSLLLALVSGTGVGQTSKPSSIVASDLERRVDAYVRPYGESGNFSGVILIARGDQKLLEKGYGYANREWRIANAPDTRFHIASVSKTFTAAAIMLLQERGKLSVQDSLSKWIPDYPRGNEITIHHLLTHTSGIRDVNDLSDYDEKSRSAHSLTDIIGWFKDKPLESSPGSKYSYSNSNYNLLAFIIEKASGQSYGDFLAANIFKPLGLYATGNDADPRSLIPQRASGYSPVGATEVENAPFLDWSIKTGNGSLYSTAADLYRWMQAMNTNGLLNETSRKQIFTDHIDGTGYGWFMRAKAKRFSIAMNGRSPGFASNIERFPDSGIYVVILSNLYTSLTRSMAVDLGAIAHGEEPRPQVAAKAVDLPAQLLEGYAGEYEFGADYPFNPVKQMAIVRRGDWIAMKAGGGGDKLDYLLPRGENDFIDRAYGGKVTFERDANGKVVAFIWGFGYEKFRAVRK